MVKVFTMVKGEVDIVNEWVLYHGYLFGFKNLYIIDNYSRDGTYELLKQLKLTYGIHITRLPDYKKKGEYMTFMIRQLCKNELAFPIDIDEFIVYYDKDVNKIICDKDYIETYLKNGLPIHGVYKMNYINGKITEQTNNNNLNNIKYGEYLDYNQQAKTFFRSNLFSGEIDHGNHYNTTNYILSNLCLVHFHTRNMEQIKKKVYNNVSGLGHNPFDIHNLKSLLLLHGKNIFGFHHIQKQIDILEGKFNLPVDKHLDTDVSLEPLHNKIKKMNYNLL